MKTQPKLIKPHMGSWLDILDKMLVDEELFTFSIQKSITANATRISQKKFKQQQYILINPETLEAVKVNKITRIK